MKIRDEWNKQADEWNQFDSLGKDEVETFADELLNRQITDTDDAEKLRVLASFVNIASLVECCDDCEYQYGEYDEYPCTMCKHNHSGLSDQSENNYEPVEAIKIAREILKK